jgi:hypothetical protein
MMDPVTMISTYGGETGELHANTTRINIEDVGDGLRIDRPTQGHIIPLVV